MYSQSMKEMCDQCMKDAPLHCSAGFSPCAYLSFRIGGKPGNIYTNCGITPWCDMINKRCPERANDCPLSLDSIIGGV